MSDAIPSAPSTLPTAGLSLSPSRAAVVLILAGLLAYANSFNKDFVYDDFFWITKNNDIENPVLYLHSLLRRGFGAATILLNYQLGGLSKPGYHAVNLAIHIGAALALFGVVRRTLLLPRFSERYSARATALAFAVALLWLVHPLNTQAVTYIIQRFESLMGLLFLLTLYSVIRGATGTASRSWYILAVVCTLLGLFTKEVMAAALPVVFLYDRVFLAESFAEMARKRWGLYVGFVGVFAVWIGVSYFLAPGAEGSGFGLAEVTWWQYALTQPEVIVYYLRLAVWPDALCLDYKDWPLNESLSQALLPGLFLIVLLLGSLWALFRRSWLGFVGMWFFLILAPTSSVMPIVDVAYEHRMYLPLAAPIVLLVFGLDWMVDYLGSRSAAAKRLALVGGACLVLLLAVVLGARTFVRNQDYATSATLWADVMAKRPSNVRARANLSADKVSEDPELTNAMLEPLLKVPQAQFILAVNYCNLAVAKKDQGQIDEALACANESLTLAPDTEVAHRLRGNLYVFRNDWPKAEEDFLWLTRRNPYLPGNCLMLALAMKKNGKTEQAQKAIEWVKSLDSQCAWKLQVSAMKLAFTDRKVNAVADKEAVLTARLACEVTDYRDSEALECLAVTLANTGKAASAREMLAANDSLSKVRRRQIEERMEMIDRLKKGTASQPSRPGGK